MYQEHLRQFHYRRPVAFPKESKIEQQRTRSEQRVNREDVSFGLLRLRVREIRWGTSLSKSREDEPPYKSDVKEDRHLSTL